MVVWVPQSKQNAYRNRKGDLTQNVIAVYDFNLMFTYVLAGWEDSANDLHVLMDALSRDANFLWPPQGEYDIFHIY